jgi:DNA-binding LacI/PurR family transcriptional regulator
MGRRRLTIRDIARIANVSRSTVSLALNDSPRINPETKRRVLQIVEEMDYHPNAMARALVGGRTRVLSLLVPQIDHVFSDFYFSETVSGVTDVVANLGYSLMLEVATESFISNGVVDRLFKERRIDGMLVVGTLTTDDWLDILREKKRPVCLINSEREGFSSVVADNRAGAGRVVDHLVELGHREIGYIKGLDITTAGLHRDEGFQAALERHGIAYDEALVAYGNFSEESGYEAMRKLLERPRCPRAIFTTNDSMAIGALHAIQEKGLSVPADISLVGGDDIRLARYISPRLSTIRQSMDLIGSLATEILFGRLGIESEDGSSPSDEPVQRVIDTELVVRESCGPAS